MEPTKGPKRDILNVEKKDAFYFRISCPYVKAFKEWFNFSL